MRRTAALLSFLSRELAPQRQADSGEFAIENLTGGGADTSSVDTPVCHGPDVIVNRVYLRFTGGAGGHLSDPRGNPILA